MERQQPIQSLSHFLLAFGLDEFSVSATSVLKTRKTIADSNIADCKALAEKSYGMHNRGRGAGNTCTAVKVKTV